MLCMMKELGIDDIVFIFICFLVFSSVYIRLLIVFHFTAIALLYMQIGHYTLSVN